MLWAHDRQRMERRNTVYDSENDYYLQEWRDLHTGEVTYRKEGRLSDPSIHGESARRPRTGHGENEPSSKPERD